MTILFLFFLNIPVFAADPGTISLDKMVLRLMPKSPQGAAATGVKTVEVTRQGEKIRLSWSALQKELVSADPYPRYKVMGLSGVLEMPGLSGAAGFFHPEFWGRGFQRLSGELPLWLDPVYLTLSGKDRRDFNIGWLGVDKKTLQAAPDAHFEKIMYFQNLYTHYGGALKTGSAGLTDSDKKALKEFARDFFQVELIAKTKAGIVVNKERVSVPARLIGNDYFQFTVLDDPDNPLVMSFRVTPEQVPSVFRKVFDYFKQHFEFQVTQVND
jgi:hypothetical protein